MIKAKPVVQDQYWILRDRDRKIGNIQADSNGYNICINDTQMRVESLDNARSRFGIDFEVMITSTTDRKKHNDVYGFPTSSEPFNVMWDVSRQIPIWTTQEKSRSLMAAGWYKIRQGSTWRVTLCPKVIILDRYQYQGPFPTRQDAMQT